MYKVIKSFFNFPTCPKSINLNSINLQNINVYISFKLFIFTLLVVMVGAALSILSFKIFTV